MTKTEKQKQERDPVKAAQDVQAEQRAAAEERFKALREHAASLAEHDRELGL